MRWGTVCESAYDQDVTLRPPQERCMFCGQAGFVDARKTCDDCRDGYAGWIELDAPPFTDGQRARLRYLLRQ